DGESRESHGRNDRTGPPAPSFPLPPEPAAHQRHPRRRGEHRGRGLEAGRDRQQGEREEEPWIELRSLALGFLARDPEGEGTGGEDGGGDRDVRGRARNPASVPQKEEG